MKTKPTSPTRAVQLPKSGIQPESQPLMTELYRRAQARLRKQRKSRRTEAGVPKLEAGPQRLLHELQVHQVELEMQNAELHEARDRLEALLEKYTDLYDFAPVGYFSLDESGRIMEANLTGAALLGVERSRLINRPLARFVAPASQPGFLVFLKRIFAGTEKQVCEASLLKWGAAPFWAGFHGAAAVSAYGPGKWCRLAVTDITSLKQAEEAQRRMEILSAANLELRREIIRRQKVEKSLKQSEQNQRRLLEQSRHMQERLRNLSRQVLRVQEDERKRISRELHDVIAQTLTGINVQLAALAKGAAINTRDLARNIARTQQAVEKAVDIVHEFARELRPAVLDDLGLIPALHSFVKIFSRRTSLPVQLKAFAGVEQLDIAKRTVLFRVAQEALTNVARHAQAGRVEVSILKFADRIILKIKDDGKSFEVKRVLHGKGGKRLGLLGMRERVEMIGGTFDVESAPGQGTAIQVAIPAAQARNAVLKKSGKTKP
jgi:PAS domain S-box-containing protein